MDEYGSLLVVFCVLLDIILVGIFVPWILQNKKDPTTAVAWCLAVILIPGIGTILFWLIGLNYIRRPVEARRVHQSNFQLRHPAGNPYARRGAAPPLPPTDSGLELAQLALNLNAFPVSTGNRVQLHHETRKAYADLLAAIERAGHHVHLEYYIVRTDETGQELLHLLTRKAQQGVQVRFLVDGVGSLDLTRRFLHPLIRAGGKVVPFLSVNPVRSRIQFNMRNHRKITVVDGRVGFTGGMNIGNEYLGKGRYFGEWRDNFLRLEGPAVAGLQRIFAEDWDFTTHEALDGADYYPVVADAGRDIVQVVEGGPDQVYNTIREIYFAAILAARQRVWIASPYFVPDSGLLDALRLARYRGVQLRLLCLLHPDHFLSFYASRYYWGEMLKLGMEVYQYRPGMMHSKVLMVDGKWAMSGSANLDNRSLHLNFEAGCLLYTAELVTDLESAFLNDLSRSYRLEAADFERRSFFTRLKENACRLLSPIL